MPKMFLKSAFLCEEKDLRWKATFTAIWDKRILAENDYVQISDIKMMKTYSQIMDLEEHALYLLGLHS